jgi:hypothetical protein
VSGPLVIPWGGEYTLHAAQEARVREIGPERYNLNRKAGTRYEDLHGDDVITNEHHQVGAILAFCSLAGLTPINLLLEKGWAGKGCINCIVPDRPGGGRECNVLFMRDRPALIKNEHAPHFTSLFVLMMGGFPTYRYRGWAAFCELIHSSNLTSEHDIPAYVLGQHRIKRDLVILAPETEE